MVMPACRERAHVAAGRRAQLLQCAGRGGGGHARGLTRRKRSQRSPLLRPADKRGQVLQLGNITVINDCYNSNPKALDAMVDALAAMPAKRRIVVAGEMLELGPAGEEMHRASGRHMAEKKIDVLIGVRGLAQAMVEAAKQAGMRADSSPRPKKPANGSARIPRRRCRTTKGVARSKTGKSVEKWKAVRNRGVVFRVLCGSSFC